MTMEFASGLVKRSACLSCKPLNDRHHAQALIPFFSEINSR